MTDNSKMSLGDLCKYYESRETVHHAMKGLPLIARLDGISFHNFTKGLDRPYDKGLSTLMLETTKYLVKETHALIGYTQSDEITLIWNVGSNSNADYMHAGKFQKICSRLSAIATGYFNVNIPNELPSKNGILALFDCRVWQVPTLREAYLNLLWRERDATKNSLTMATSCYYSHTQLFGKNSADKHEMLFQKSINWNGYPVHFKRGIYVQRAVEKKFLSEEELMGIPEKNRPTEPVNRSIVKILDIPPLDKIANPEQVLFLNGDAILKITEVKLNDDIKRV